eukprot:scpid19783/ scgid3868/ Kinesin-like protein KIF6
MVKHGIQIYARLKPTKRKTGVFEASDLDGEDASKLTFVVPRKEADGFVNNKKESYHFRFNRIFQPDAAQDEVFDHVAKSVIDNVIAGYNGTIFAYGQTGSGKTFTITGGVERYSDRGLIPRSLSYIFKYQKENPDKLYTTQVTYMEIYNEQGHDLLDPEHEGAKLEDLPKVHLMEDTDGQIALKNLSVHEASSEEGALNLLFLGDTNRMIAETPMNMASTRSHCIFSIHMTSREPGSAVIRRSKLHLVDLAGSERIGKTGVAGKLLSEAKYINLSLHYLEQVITALTEKGRSHIPYRNSMMTSVLRDSLGGNCMTTMIATCSVERGNIDESISTCRFAQRVAMIKNDASLNEELSPKLMVARLQQQVKDLRDELKLATGEERTEELTDEEKARCVDQVKAYVEREEPLSVGADMRKIHLCFHLLRDLVVESRQELADKARQASAASRLDTRQSTSEQAIHSHRVGATQDTSRIALPAEVDRLQELLEQRDNEINILVNMLKREKKRVAEALAQSGSADRTTPSPRTTAASPSPRSVSDVVRPQAAAAHHHAAAAMVTVSPRQQEAASHSTARHKAIQDLTVGQREAYELFRRDYHNTATMEESKATLKDRYAYAKTLGEVVHQSRLDLNSAKKDLEKYRVSAAVRGVTDGETGIPDTIDAEEQALRDRLQDAKQRFKTSLTELKDVKSEIDHRKHLLETSRIQLLKDFQAWWTQQGHDQSQTPGGLSSSSSRNSSRAQSQRTSSRARSTAESDRHQRPGVDMHPSSQPSSVSTLSSSRGHHGTDTSCTSSTGNTPLSTYQPSMSRSHHSPTETTSSLSARQLDFSRPPTASSHAHHRSGAPAAEAPSRHRGMTLAAHFSRPSATTTTSSAGMSSDTTALTNTSSTASSFPQQSPRQDSSGYYSSDVASGTTSARSTAGSRAYSTRSQPHEDQQLRQQQPSYNTATPSGGSSSLSSSRSSSRARSSNSRPATHTGGGGGDVDGVHASQPLTGDGDQYQRSASRDQSALSPRHGNTTPRQITLTGDSRADADIIAFMKARQSLLEKGQM